MKILEEKAPEIAPGRPTPYTHFKLVSTPKLWEWWRNKDEYERQENLLDYQVEDIVSKSITTSDEKLIEKGSDQGLEGDGSLNTEIVPQPFKQGEMVFYSDRVELCRIDICSGPRCQSKIFTLDLLKLKQSNGAFVPYSGSKLEAAIKLKGSQITATGLIRDLRNDIVKALLSKGNLFCDGKTIILSRGPCYRFADCITVYDGEQVEPEEKTDMDDDSDVHNVHNEGFENVPNDDVSERRAWILQRLAEGCLSRSSHVVDHFNSYS